jgi:hypothetical protein
MEETFEERARILLKAMLDMMKQQEEVDFVKSVFELIAIWDEAECDGLCWQEEVRALLEFF